jgi:hypothetical protein
MAWRRARWRSEAVVAGGGGSILMGWRGKLCCSLLDLLHDALIVVAGARLRIIPTVFCCLVSHLVLRCSQSGEGLLGAVVLYLLGMSNAMAVCIYPWICQPLLYYSAWRTWRVSSASWSRCLAISPAGAPLRSFCPQLRGEVMRGSRARMAGSAVGAPHSVPVLRMS